MKVYPFSLLVDGSNETTVEKVNPLTVKIFDVERKQVVTHLLDVCTTSGRDCGTSSVIFNKIDSILDRYNRFHRITVSVLVSIIPVSILVSIIISRLTFQKKTVPATLWDVLVTLFTTLHVMPLSL